jgi:Flp pilus assembly protein TadB
LIVGCALLAAIGAAFMLRGLVPARPPLALELERLLTPTPRSPAPSGFADALGAAVWALLDPSDDRFPALARDLAVMDLSPSRLVAQSLVMAAGGAALAGAMVAVLALGGLEVPAALGAWGVVLLAAGGGVAPRAVVHSRAAEQRAEMREATALVCDLAAVAIAAGDGLEAALAAAVAPGGGWAFAALRHQLAAAGARREAPWTALDDLGVRLGVGELVELAHTLALGGLEGARVRDALAAQSRSVRERAAAEVEAKAGSVTERMSFPLVLLLAGFTVVIGYPAVSRL